jgi:hypothetical protein
MFIVVKLELPVVFDVEFGDNQCVFVNCLIVLFVGSSASYLCVHSLS